MTEEQVEAELDKVFVELGYLPNEFPFDRGWREDGCTSRMVLRFCEIHSIVCHIYRGTVKHGSEVESYTPPDADSNSPRISFFIRDDHCFFYGKSDGAPCHAKQAISQIWREPVDDDEEDEFRDKELLPFFSPGDAALL